MPLQEIPLNAFINSDTEDGIPIPVDAPKFDEKNSTPWNGAISNSFRKYQKGLYFFGQVLDIKIENNKIKINDRILDSDKLYKKIDAPSKAWVYDATHVICKTNNELRYGEIVDGTRIEFLEIPLKSNLTQLYVVANSQQGQTYIIMMENPGNSSQIAFSVNKVVNASLSKIGNNVILNIGSGNNSNDIRVPGSKITKINVNELSASLMADNKLIIGFKTDSIVTSFSVVLNSATNPNGGRKVIMGYGAVHPSGDLYGNILPHGLVNTNGLITLKERTSLEGVTFGSTTNYPNFNEEQNFLLGDVIYYYSPMSSNLVSHFKYVGGIHKPNELGMANNIISKRFSLNSSDNQDKYTFGDSRGNFLTSDAAWAGICGSCGISIYGLTWNTALPLTGFLLKTYDKQVNRYVSRNGGESTYASHYIDFTSILYVPLMLFSYFSTTHVGTPYGMEAPIKGVLFLYPQNETQWGMEFGTTDYIGYDGGKNNKQSTIIINPDRKVFVLETFEGRVSVPAINSPSIQTALNVIEYTENHDVGINGVGKDFSGMTKTLRLNFKKLKFELSFSEQYTSNVKVDLGYFKIPKMGYALINLADRLEHFNITPNPDEFVSKDIGTFPTLAPYNALITSGLYHANFGDGSGYLYHDDTKLTSSSIPNNLILANAVSIFGLPKIIAYFLTNGGTPIPPVQSNTIPFALQLPPYSGITRPGYTADGWDAVAGTMIGTTTGIRLRWTANKYTLSLYLDNEKLLDIPDIEYDSPFTIPNIVGKVITGFSIGSESYSFGDMVYWHWLYDQNAYCSGGQIVNITFDFTGGTGALPVPIDGYTGLEVAIPLPSPNDTVKNGYLPITWEIGGQFLHPPFDNPNFIMVQTATALCQWAEDKSPLQFFVAVVTRTGIDYTYLNPGATFILPNSPVLVRPVFTINGVSVASGGRDYAIGDRISLIKNTAVVTVNQINGSGAITAVSLTTGFGTAMFYKPSSPMSGTNQVGNGLGATFTVNGNESVQRVSSPFTVNVNAVIFEVE